MTGLDQALDTLKKRFLFLGTLVEESVEKAVDALLTGNADQADAVINKDKEIDALEISIEEDCVNILALQQPMAADLRLIIAILKINNDLERIADLSVNIAQHVKRIESVATLDDIKTMAADTKDMLQKSLQAFLNMDTGLAQAVLDLDDKVDDQKANIRKGVIKNLSDTDLENRGQLAKWSTAQSLERIADLSTNIAEEVIYISRGDIVRHHHKEA